MNNPTAPRPAAGNVLRSDNLTCGADVDTLLEQVADGRGGHLTAHQQDCLYCQAAIGELTALWAPLRALAAVPVPPPPGLTATVMGRIRRVVRDAGYSLQITDGGAIRIAAGVVAALARESASRVPGVCLALGRTARAGNALSGQPRARTAAGVLGQTAVVDLAIAVNHDRPVHDVARAIQRQVTAALRNNLGLQAVTVNVTIDDILDVPD